MKPKRGGPFLTRLTQDTCGNTLAIMAAAFIPLVGLIGGGVDMSRMYLVKTRLQQACDAGALSGRKAMGGGSWTSATETRANQLFDANFSDGEYGTGTLTRTFEEDDGMVTGTASVGVPMTLMRVFGFAEQTMEVACTAKMEIPNTDVMFVLDVTGSMNCAPEDANLNCYQGVSTSSKRITGLKKAVNCFYETVARLDTTEDCGSTPSGGAGTAQIRFGFVPYATNVNVGRLLPHDYMVDSWYYQTRRANVEVPPAKVETNVWQVYSGGSISKSNCLKYMNNEAFGSFSPTPASSGGPIPAPTVEMVFHSDGSATEGSEWGWSGPGGDNSGTSRSCRRRVDRTTTYYQEKFQNWTYGRFLVDVSGLKGSGGSWANGFPQPSSTSNTDTESVASTTPGNDVPATTINWDGCIEERETVVTDDFDPIPSDAYDLDIDLIPNSEVTRWKPALPDLIYSRSDTWNLSEETTTDGSGRKDFGYACPTEAKKLQAWSTASSFSSYVSSLTPSGYTYHDIGLLWGARLMSPTGIFASENALTPNGGAINRHMIFMTDGDTNGQDDEYAAYGLPWFDRRQTPDTSAPSKTDIDDQINARFSALCTAVRNKNITLWVISFGASVNTTTQARLQACATPGKYFTAADSATLISQFQQIASEIADLRLTS